MAFRCTWIEEKRVIYTEMISTMTSNEAQKISDAHMKFLNEGAAPVHLIVDLTQLKEVPTNMRQNTSMAGYLQHSSLGWTVLIGGNVLINFMLSILGHVFKFRYVKRATLEESLAYPVSQDQTLITVRTA
jgi:hypothetical protein